MYHLLNRVYWPSLREYVRSYLASCSVCLARKSPCTRRAPMGHVSVGHRCGCVAMVILDISVATPKGNRYVLVMVDCFSRWTEACPLPNKSSVIRFGVTYLRVVGILFLQCGRQSGRAHSERISETCSALAWESPFLSESSIGRRGFRPWMRISLYYLPVLGSCSALREVWAALAPPPGFWNGSALRSQLIYWIRVLVLGYARCPVSRPLKLPANFTGTCAS